MAIKFIAEQVAKPGLKYILISNWLKRIIVQHSKKPGEITYIFCDDSFLLDINLKFLKHNYYTDIITFDYVNKNVISGDIFISVERVADNSVKYGVNLEDEFLRVISHGILHLLNYNDQTKLEKKLIRKLESDCIVLYKHLENDGSIKV
jgi:probable rRNA maturation factor